jgi:hypothetical protein
MTAKQIAVKRYIVKLSEDERERLNSSIGVSRTSRYRSTKSLPGKCGAISITPNQIGNSTPPMPGLS